ncbi:MAG: uracil-DNA glycosylase [Planctomycetes bacterium]|nr:uracil-DNA glycosylase [Planctomycetota bacterium]
MPPSQDFTGDRWIAQIREHLRIADRAGLEWIARPARIREPARPNTDLDVATPASARPIPPLDVADRVAALASLDDEVKRCTRCEICHSRKQTVFGEGSPTARLVFVGEAPGFEEDRTGRPFVGPAGQLLTKMIEAIRLKREEVYIANVLKCRPPNNRTPEQSESDNCFPYLHAQIRTIRPEVICTLGAPAARAVLGLEKPVGQMRGRIFHFEDITVVPTYHPAYLLRNPADKVLVGKDLQVVAK